MGGMHPGANNSMMGMGPQSQHAHQYMNGNGVGGGPGGMNPAAMGPMSGSNSASASMQMNQMGGGNAASQMNGMLGYGGSVAGPTTTSARHHQVSYDKKDRFRNGKTKIEIFTTKQFKRNFFLYPIQS